ncbi:sugar transferase [Succiniclasticum ruminis]|uniref:sugar transferase n=1 Tax=Succiniclasticum ruminis TaxID=40841 RepID=UPI001C4099F5
MSVVGPRLLLVRYLPLYNDHHARRHEIRPSFTGLAQVHGRNATSWGKTLTGNLFLLHCALYCNAKELVLTRMLHLRI